MHDDQDNPVPDSLAMLGADWYWEQDDQGRYTTIAPRAACAPVIPPHGFIGRRRWELPGFRPVNFGLETHLQQLDRRQAFRDLQFCVEHHGRVVCLTCTGEPRYAAGGEVLGWRGTARDITREWQDRRAREDAERLLHMAARLGRFGAWSYDVDTNLCIWSEAVCEIHDVPPGFRCTPEQGIAFYARRDRPMVHAMVERCVRLGRPFDYEAQVVAAGGRRTWVRVLGQAVRDDAGRIVRVEGALQDIEALRALAHERERIAQRLTVTLQGLTDGLFTLDHDWRITYVNPEALRVFRLPEQEVVGQDLWSVFPEARGTAFETEYQRAITTRRPVEFHAYYAPLDVWGRIRAWPTAEGVTVSFVDISAQKRAELELQELNAQLEARVQQRTAELEAATQELGTLSYAIAHDVRAPLASVAGFSEALERMLEGRVPERAADYLRRIRAAAALMDTMTEGLLQLARIERGPSAQRVVDVSELAAQAWSVIQAQDPARAVQLRIQPAMRAFANPAQLASILQNLLANAWKFTSCTPTPCVDVGMERRGREAVFHVRDNGSGFDAAHAARLFKPFQRLHGRDVPGTGLGLATVDKLARVQGGRAWAEGRPGEGATFYFSLSAADADAPHATEAS